MSLLISSSPKCIWYLIIYTPIIREQESHFFPVQVLSNVKKSGWKIVIEVWVPLVYILVLNDMWAEWVGEMLGLLPFMVIMNRDSYSRTDQNGKTGFLLADRGSMWEKIHSIK